MKAFWISILLFALLLGGIFVNARFIHRTSDTLTEYAEELSESSCRAQTLEELEAFWEKRRPLISLTVGFRELDHFGEVIAQLRWAHDLGDETEFLRYRSLLLDAITELSRTEQFSVENLF